MTVDLRHGRQGHRAFFSAEMDVMDLARVDAGDDAIRVRVATPAGTFYISGDEAVMAAAELRAAGLQVIGRGGVDR